MFCLLWPTRVVGRWRPRMGPPCWNWEDREVGGRHGNMAPAKGSRRDGPWDSLFGVITLHPGLVTAWYASAFLDEWFLSKRKLSAIPLWMSDKQMSVWQILGIWGWGGAYTLALMSKATGANCVSRPRRTSYGEITSSKIPGGKVLWDIE